MKSIDTYLCKQKSKSELLRESIQKVSDEIERMSGESTVFKPYEMALKLAESMREDRLKEKANG